MRAATAAGTPPASTARTSAARRRTQLVELGLGHGRGRPPGAGCARSRWVPGRRCRAAARSAPRAAKNAARRRTAAAPGSAASRRRSPSSDQALDSIAGVRGRVPARPRLPAAARATIRCPTVITDSERPAATAPTSRPQLDAEAGEQAADADDDQPLGALGDADVGGQAQALGARLDVGDDLAGDQAEQAATAASTRWPARWPARRPRRRRWRRRRPGPWSSRAARRTGWTCRAARAIAPSSTSVRRAHVTITVRRRPGGRGRRRRPSADEHADRAGDGDRVRATRRARSSARPDGSNDARHAALERHAEDLRHGVPP